MKDKLLTEKSTTLIILSIYQYNYTGRDTTLLSTLFGEGVTDDTDDTVIFYIPYLFFIIYLFIHLIEKTVTTVTTVTNVEISTG